MDNNKMNNNENDNESIDKVSNAMSDFLNAISNLPEDQLDILFNNLKDLDQNNNK